MSRLLDRDRIFTFSRFLWQRFIDDKCFETAGALSYTTLVSLVPLTLAVVTMISAFPVFAPFRDTLLNYVFDNFVPAASQEVQDALDKFATNANKLTGISILVMLFSALSMMVSIEDRLNLIWRVRHPRGWGSRLLLYWAALTLGPILVVGGIAVTSYVIAMPLLQDATAQIGFGRQLLKALPFVVTFVTLLLLYTVVPNKQVSRRDAAIGALLGAVLFEFARWGFALFVRHAQTYDQIYGALAALPILLLWIYLSWVIVILGASIAASISAFEYQPSAARLSEDAAFIGLLVVLRHFVDAQRAGRTVDAALVRTSEPCLQSGAIACYFDDLDRAGLLQRGEAGGWLLKRSLDSTDLLHVYRHSGYRLPLNPREEAAAHGMVLPDELFELLDKVAATLDNTFDARLDQAYPPAAPVVSSSTESTP